MKKKKFICTVWFRPCKRNHFSCHICSGKRFSMEYGTGTMRKGARCLECGDKISYGRTDKKFCCEECKNRHHNHLHNSSRRMKRKVQAILDRNYEILSGLADSGLDAMWLDEAVTLGFNPIYMTSFVKGRRCGRYSCYDISYSMNDGRIFSISKIQNLSLNLQAGQKVMDHVCK